MWLLFLHYGILRIPLWSFLLLLCLRHERARKRKFVCSWFGDYGLRAGSRGTLELLLDHQEKLQIRVVTSCKTWTVGPCWEQPQLGMNEVNSDNTKKTQKLIKAELPSTLRKSCLVIPTLQQALDRVLGHCKSCGDTLQHRSSCGSCGVPLFRTSSA